MRVLLIGSGGRENAIAWSVYALQLLKKLYCITGNPGIKEFAVCIDVNISNNSLIFHSGTKSDKLDNLLTNSGRVLSITSLAKNIDKARKKVYEDIKKIKFDKAFYRKDIGL